MAQWGALLQRSGQKWIDYAMHRSAVLVQEVPFMEEVWGNAKNIQETIERKEDVK